MQKYWFLTAVLDVAAGLLFVFFAVVVPLWDAPAEVFISLFGVDGLPVWTVKITGFFLGIFPAMYIYTHWKNFVDNDPWDDERTYFSDSK